MTANRARIAFVGLLLFAAACGGRPNSSPTSQSRNLLSSDEMLKAGYADVLMTVQSLRPQWLQRRGSTSMRSSAVVKVYLDGSLMGGPDQLRQIFTRSISSVRYYNELEASERWGLDHSQGAIVVSTRREPRGP